MTAADRDTPGQAAMRDAARLESARVYGQTLAVPTVRDVALERTRCEHDERDRQILAMHARGCSLATIALRLGLSKSKVDNILQRAS